MLLTRAYLTTVYFPKFYTQTIETLVIFNNLISTHVPSTKIKDLNNLFLPYYTPFSIPSLCKQTEFQIISEF